MQSRDPQVLRQQTRDCKTDTESRFGHGSKFIIDKIHHKGLSPLIKSI